MSSPIDEVRPHLSDGAPDANEANTAEVAVSTNPFHAQHDITDFFVPDSNPIPFDSLPQQQQQQHSGSGSDGADHAPAGHIATPSFSDHEDDPPTMAAFYHDHDYFASAADPAHHPPPEQQQQHDDYYSGYYDADHQPQPSAQNVQTQLHDVPHHAVKGFEEATKEVETAPASYGLAFADMAGHDEGAGAHENEHNNYNHGYQGNPPRYAQGIFVDNTSGAFGEDDPSTKEAKFFYVEPSVHGGVQHAAHQGGPAAESAAMPPSQEHTWQKDEEPVYDNWRKKPEPPSHFQPYVARDPFQTDEPLQEEGYSRALKKVPVVSAPIAEDSAPRPDRLMRPLGPNAEDEETPDVSESTMSAPVAPPTSGSPLEEPMPEATAAPPAPQHEEDNDDHVSSSSSSSPKRQESVEEKEAETPASPPPDATAAAAAALLGETEEEAAVQERAAHIAALEERMRARARDIAVDIRQTEEEGGAGPSAEEISEEEEEAPAAPSADSETGEHQKTAPSPTDAGLPLSSIVNEEHHPQPENVTDSIDKRGEEKEAVTVNLNSATHSQEVSEQDDEAPLRGAPEPPQTSDSDEDYLHTTGYHNAPEEHRDEGDPAQKDMFDDFYYGYGETKEQDKAQAHQAEQQQPVQPAAAAATALDELFQPVEHTVPVVDEPPHELDAFMPHEAMASSDAYQEHPAEEVTPPVAITAPAQADVETSSTETPEPPQEAVPEVSQPLEEPSESDVDPARALIGQMEEHVPPADTSSDSDDARTPPLSSHTEKADEAETPEDRTPPAAAEDEEMPKGLSPPPIAKWDGGTLDEGSQAYGAIDGEHSEETEVPPAEPVEEEGHLPEHTVAQQEDDTPMPGERPSAEQEASVHTEPPPVPRDEEEEEEHHVGHRDASMVEAIEEPETLPFVLEGPQDWNEHLDADLTAQEEAREPSVKHVDPAVHESVDVEERKPGEEPALEDRDEEEEAVPSVEAPVEEIPHDPLPVEQFIPSNEHDYQQGWSQGAPAVDYQWDTAPSVEPVDGPVAVQVATVSSKRLEGELMSDGEPMFSNQLADGAVAPVPFDVATVNSMHLQRHSSTEPVSGTGSQQVLYSNYLIDQAAVPVAVGVTAVPSVPLASYEAPQQFVPDVDANDDGWGTGAPVMEAPPPAEQDIYVNAPPPAAEAEVAPSPPPLPPPMEQFQEETEATLQREEDKSRRRPPHLAPIHHVPSTKEMLANYTPVTDVAVNSNGNNDDVEKNDVQLAIEEEERRTVEVNSFVQKMRRQNAAPHTKKMLNSVSVFSEETTDAMAATDNANVSISDPNDGSFYPRRQSKMMPVYLYFTRNTFVQIFFFLLYLVALIMSFVRLCGGGGQTCWFTFILMLFYVVDMALLFGYQQRSRLRIPPFVFRAAEPAILFLLFLCELVSWILWGTTHRRSGGYVVFSFFCFVLWLAHGLTRLEQFVFGLRVLCSADRRRYQADGFDLDLSYVHHNIIAMAWPADNFEKLFRNDVVQVADFLNRRHPQSYLVINLCSERTYNPTAFHHQTSWYPMDDHNPCELEMMVTFCQECSEFIGEDMYSRVLAIHCKGGKGRTGALICALMMYMGIKRETKSALHHFARLRTKVGSNKFQGVQAPSQGRYVQYFEELIKLNNNNDVALYGGPSNMGSANNKDVLRIPRAQVRITRLRIMNLPHLWYSMGIGKLYFVLITKPSTDRRVHFISNSDVQFSSKVPDPSSYTKKQLRDLFGSDEDNLYNACNILDPNFTDENETGVGHHGYKLDNESFWFYLNNDWSRRLDYEAFHVAMRNHSMGAPPTGGSKKAQAVPEMNVSIEYRFPESIPALDGDVVLKFFYARNDPNPLESPVQVWFHTAMEQRKQQGTHFAFAREDIDGPPKDKKFKRYPEGFSMEIVVE